MMISYLFAIVVFLLWVFYSRRVFRSGPGDRVMKSGVLTLTGFTALPLLIEFDVPDWFLLSWLTLVIVLCSRARRAMRRVLDRRHSAD